MSKSTKRITTDSFIERCIKLHGNLYDYTKTKYINSRASIKYDCRVHGEIEQNARTHLIGHGCPKCNGNLSLSNEDFIQKVSIIHNFKYDYSDTVFKNLRSYINYKCPEHGEISQFARHHLEGYGCSRCTGKTLTCKDFTDRMKEIHRR